MIEVIGISKSYAGKKILDDINMRFEDGMIYCLMGESGIGKTTLLRLIMKLEKPDSGSIKGNSDIAAMFQEDRLIMDRTPVDNVLFVTKGHGKYSDREHIVKAMSEILPKECLDKPVSQLSGGMKRRAALARAMLSDRGTVILDEPFTGLDNMARRDAIQFILEYQNGRTIILVTHDKNDADMLNAGICLLTMKSAVDTMVRGFDISEV